MDEPAAAELLDRPLRQAQARARQALPFRWRLDSIALRVTSPDGEVFGIVGHWTEHEGFRVTAVAKPRPAAD